MLVRIRVIMLVIIILITTTILHNTGVVQSTLGGPRPPSTNDYQGS